MTTQAYLAAIIPPTTQEWMWMANYHLRALLAAYVIANGSPSSVMRVPAKEMGDVVTELGRAADFHRSFAELCETAERRAPRCCDERGIGSRARVEPQDPPGYLSEGLASPPFEGITFEIQDP